jgi:succinate dehydrogenase / fumarate reductase cytochrome b subunit
VYRGQSGMWAWLLHRVTGVAVLLFLLIHIIDITMLGFGPDVYNASLEVFKTPLIRIVSVGLLGGVIYHSFNGCRIVLVDFWAKGAKYQRQLTYTVYVATIVTTLIMAYYVMLPVFEGCRDGLCGR